MRRALLVSLVAMVLAAPAALVGPARAEAPAWAGQPTLIGGTSRYDRGEWIHTDFVYDDYGADTGSWGQPNVVSLATTTGDARYPAGDRFGGNAADIVEVRVRRSAADPGGLDIRVLLQTIADPTVPAIWVRTASGDERVLTHLNATVDAAANTVEFVLPGAASEPFTAIAVGAGLNDGAGGLRAGVAGTTRTAPNEYTTGAPTANRLFDLAFNTRAIEGRGGAWNEDVQAKALAAGGDALAPFSQSIDVAALDAGVTTPPPTEPGYYVRLFESRQDLGEGMGAAFPQYRGRWQPYAVWVPVGYSPASPAALLLNLHSLSVHHNQYRGGSSSSYRTLYEQMGDGVGAVVVTPLGRGPDGWYLDEGLVDTLEVWADARRHYAIDDQRTFVSGYSMGGYGTYRLATLFPDRFAAAASIVGPPTNGIWVWPFEPSGANFTHHQLENTRHVPFWVTHGVLDELVPFLGVRAQAERLRELGHEYRFALHPAEDHLTFGFKDDWRREAAWFRAHPTRVVDPERVTFEVRPASWATGGDETVLAHVRALGAELGARLDGAYWVGGVAVATGSPGDDVTGSVDLATGAAAHRVVRGPEIRTVGTDGPSPHLLEGLDVRTVPKATADTLSGTLANVTAITVDVGRAGLSDNPAVAVTADRPVTITFVRAGAVVGQRTI